MDIFDIFTMFGGMGLFLYGMHLMGEGLRSAAGNRLKRILEKLTTNRVMGVIVGFVVTAIIQSSSATTVMLVGFVNAGLMSISQAFGVILGANIGTTVTAQIIAFKLSNWAPLFIIVGIIPMLFAKKRSVRYIGTIIAGFGILFTGMNIMGDALKPLKDELWFVSFMTNFENPLLGILLGAAATSIIQSSSATIGIVQAMAVQGLMASNAAFHIVLGCNIGTCITAILASIGTNIHAKRTAGVHLSFNILGTLIFILVLMLTPYTKFIVALSPGDISRQIADFHTFFNVICTVLLLPFGTPIIKLVTKVVKGNPEEENRMRLLYLDERTLDAPMIAMVQMKKEVARVADRVGVNVDKALAGFFELDEIKTGMVFEEHEAIKHLCTQIVGYLVKIQAIPTIGDEDKREVFKMHDLVTDLKRIDDHALSIANYAQDRRDNKPEFSGESIEELREMSAMAKSALFAGLESVTSGVDDERARDESVASNRQVVAIQNRIRQNHIDRLNCERCNPKAGMIFTDMVIDLGRISDLAVNIADISVGETTV